MQKKVTEARVATDEKWRSQGGDCLEQLGDVGRTTRISTGVTIGLWGRLRVTLTLTPSGRVCSGIGLTVLLLRFRSWWSRGLLLCRPGLLLLGSRDGLQTEGTQESNPWGWLLWVHCSLR